MIATFLLKNIKGHKKPRMLLQIILAIKNPRRERPAKINSDITGFPIYEMQIFDISRHW